MAVEGWPTGVGETAAALAERLETESLLFAAGDDPRAEAVARALAVASPDALVLFCPGSDALPGEDAAASAANVGRRVSALHRLHRALADTPDRRVALVTTGEALGRLYPRPEAFDTAPPRVQVGDPADFAGLAAELATLGYLADDRVDEPGEMAVRGEVVDIFPADADQPFRIEAADGRLIAIRAYDAASQRTLRLVEELELGHAAEPALAGGIVLPDHMADATLLIEPAAEERRRRFLALAEDARQRRPTRALRGVADEQRWAAALAATSRADLAGTGERPPRFVEDRDPLRAFTRYAKKTLAAGDRLVLLGTPRDLRFVGRRAGAALDRPIVPAASWAAVAAGEPASLHGLAMPAERGFCRPGIVAVAAADLLGGRASRDGGGASHDLRLFDLGDIAVGDVVVHEDHGIGLVDGLEPMPADEHGGGGGDAIVLRYADDGRRLVPVAHADRIWRYGADADAVTLDRLDGHSWQKRRGAIDAAVAESARALAALAAERAQAKAPRLVPDTAAYERFAAGFPFVETADQARAIAAVRGDLAAGRPMDRLVVGDVGYGKTEVALRAAAVAALAGAQVAVAAPTTVLARQHLESFTARFEGTGLKVAGLSRLSSAAEKKAVKQGLADGSVRVVIGTGAVAGKGVAYRELGLVIVDEEQRFGAADKDKLRALGAGHLLSLSATPIPRTLQGALVGLRGLSVIATPPARRQPIRTGLGPFDGERVRMALLREKSRGGQSFVVVPRIEDMGPLARQLGELVPELDLLQAHGKMPPAEIDEAMVRFGRGDGDVLLATNIIEAGLDVPRANTMAIVHADRFGLSQLHQLRGRVGRGSRRGQVLLLTDAEDRIAPHTLKRLRTLQAFDRLGAGFQISARDLDMRGAGDLMGEAQAGHMKLIGVDLYQYLLAGALAAARGDTHEHWSPELHLGVEGRLPADWIPEPEVRVTLYARLARINGTAQLDGFEAELEDRFGALPAPAATLIAVTRARLLACAAQVARVDAGPAAIAVTPRHGFAGDAAGAGLVEKKGRLLLAERIAEPEARLNRVAEVLHALAA
jgi:transcription-repair coupling factor (superfamily II helicase)